MRKISFFMLLACLLTTTAFVFANGKKFLNAGLVVQDASSNYHQISNEASLTAAGIQTTTAGNEMKVTNRLGTELSVFFHDGAGNYTPVRSDNSW